ncbi:hypothetical protein [Loigolactobacillus backii]|uniref:Uncharacterized protein n=1 Tax=Loigolactobacillus backii TaxID=375175 RepID=A0A192H4X1_9LACO|nr:hypothetical protein [Loigolactobacillus backii]ANK59926.1 hypothetical protein AYR52_06415 [Loigolactobacillus backii]ANK63262.1 hypothetical protein AYR53_11080 [Loigolactobacillus backii]ANK64860.1 hypothetical protein AYR54_06095 [Loigolactobacillus backii]ANK66693.1 hypothetical protein AYR55_02660 [Loigolactobacillus backii]ANK69732.1 hypothetical protein AYR56_05925 [Loigolactobacillus backii]
MLSIIELGLLLIILLVEGWFWWLIKIPARPNWWVRGGLVLLALLLLCLTVPNESFVTAKIQSIFAAGLLIVIAVWPKGLMVKGILNGAYSTRLYTTIISIQLRFDQKRKVTYLAYQAGPMAHYQLRFKKTPTELQSYLEHYFDADLIQKQASKK